MSNMPKLERVQTQQAAKKNRKRIAVEQPTNSDELSQQIALELAEKAHKKQKLENEHTEALIKAMENVKSKHEVGVFLFKVCKAMQGWHERGLIEKKILTGMRAIYVMHKADCSIDAVLAHDRAPSDPEKEEIFETMLSMCRKHSTI